MIKWELVVHIHGFMIMAIFEDARLEAETEDDSLVARSYESSHGIVNLGMEFGIDIFVYYLDRLK
jgi:hypothetical protein